MRNDDYTFLDFLRKGCAANPYPGHLSFVLFMPYNSCIRKEQTSCSSFLQKLWKELHFFDLERSLRSYLIWLLLKIQNGVVSQIVMINLLSGGLLIYREDLRVGHPPPYGKHQWEL